MSCCVCDFDFFVVNVLADCGKRESFKIAPSGLFSLCFVELAAHRLNATAVYLINKFSEECKCFD